MDSSAAILRKRGRHRIRRFSNHASTPSRNLPIEDSEVAGGLCIEMATSKKVVVEPGQSLNFGDKKLPVDDRNRVVARLPPKDDLEYIPFHQFLDGAVPSRQIKGKIVIIGYDGAQIHSIPSSIGPIHAHRFFIYSLQSVYEQLGN